MKLYFSKNEEKYLHIFISVVDFALYEIIRTIFHS